MEIRYPILILVFVVLFVLVFFIKIKKKKKNNIKVANTNIVKRTAYYKNLLMKYRIILYLLYGVLFIGVVSTSFLSARIFNRSVISEAIYNRDIILCLDVSTSVDKLNMELVDTYNGLITGLKGERIGISIFNRSSYTLVPLTEDYDYLKETLYKMGESLKYRNFRGYDHKYSASDLYSYIITGTLTGSNERGSSIVGDGLASCIYSFPKLDEKRSRAIILVTDNEVLGQEMISVIDAAKIAKKKNITIYSIMPTKSLNKNKNSLIEATNITSGKLYIQNDDVSLIIDEINQKEKSLLEGNKEEIDYDNPTIPFIVLMFSFAGILFLEREMIK